MAPQFKINNGSLKPEICDSSKIIMFNNLSVEIQILVKNWLSQLQLKNKLNISENVIKSSNGDRGLVDSMKL